jgi:hypothetical protein
MPDQHPLDGVADELSGWMDDTVGYLVDSFKGGHRAPFTASASEKQKRDYYTTLLWNTHPDGTPNYDSPNQSGRDKLLRTVGIPGYKQIVKSMMPKQGMSMAPDEEEPPQSLPTDAIDRALGGG